MSAIAHRSEEPQANEYEWLEFPDRVEMSPASVWVPDYEEGTASHRKSIWTRYLEQVTPIRDESRMSQSSPRARVLDESRVLPGEASFANVVLNQPIEPTAVKESEQLTSGRAEESCVSPAKPRARVLDESEVLPGEASFANVVLNQPIESTTVKESEWLTSSSLEESGESTEASVSPASLRARVLDESEVLPGEASFATVVLNQPIEPIIKESEWLTSSSVEESCLSTTSPRTRVFDEVLPGQASLAAAMLNAPNAARTYSPMEEFLAKSDLNWRKLTLAALILFSISVGITLAILKIRETSNFSSHPTANKYDLIYQPKVAPAPAQKELPTSSPSKSASISEERKQVSQPVISTPVDKAKVVVTTGETANKKLPKSAASESSRTAASGEVKLNMSSKVSRQDAKSAVSKAASTNEVVRRKPTAQQKPASVKEPITNKRAAHTRKVEVKNSRSETGVRIESSSLSREAAAKQPKPEAKTTLPSGGGQRPRTVTSKDP